MYLCIPPTLHKIFVHEKKIIESFIIPKEQMPEEDQQAMHKDLKRFRGNSGRKNSTYSF